MLQFSISLLFNQSLDTLLPAALRSLNLASNRLEARGYLPVHEDLFLAILLLCFIGFASAVFFFVLFIVSSARILPLFSSHFISSDLVTPCCFTTVLYWFVDNFSESKRSSVFFYEYDDVGLSLVTSPSSVASPLSLTLRNTGQFTWHILSCCWLSAILCMLVSPEWLLMSTKIVNVFIDAGAWIVRSCPNIVELWTICRSVCI